MSLVDYSSSSSEEQIGGTDDIEGINKKSQSLVQFVSLITLPMSNSLSEEEEDQIPVETSKILDTKEKKSLKLPAPKHIAREKKRENRELKARTSDVISAPDRLLPHQKFENIELFTIRRCLEMKCVI
jgi:hypothetical protein